MHARYVQCRGGVNFLDVAVRDGAAQDRRVQQARRFVVIDESAATGQKSEIFGPLNFLADVDVAGGCHGPAPVFCL